MSAIVHFTRDPAFQLDELLALLDRVPSSGRQKRMTIFSKSPCGKYAYVDEGWEADAGGYGVVIVPEYKCGFAEQGDGKVLTVVTQRLTDPFEVDEGGTLRLSTVFRRDSYEHPKGRTHSFTRPGWLAIVRLRNGGRGRGESEHPGTAALLAYLRAWGVLAPEEV